MTPEAWKRVKDIFDAAAELPAGARQGFVARACAGDGELRAEVESLLGSLDEAGSFIERPVMTAATAVTAPAFYEARAARQGTAIGQYRILQVLGEGGMGTVYQAVRDDDMYRKLVAIKVMKSGLNSEFAVRKFETERQILAHLDHPNIARLVDAGTTAEGQPYFVMDFIAGATIDEYCDSERLTIRQRLTLFLTVCSAIQYAHQNLIVHRDIKPQNILITSDGTARLLDFGIAKLLDPEREAKKNVSATVPMMTPQYASPEQLRGEPVTTVSDIYSMGVLLYQLLTGHTPYAPDNRSAQAMFEQICNAEPRRPSTVWRQETEQAHVVSELRRTKPERLARQLAGDLDNILLLALRKEPQRRYSSVEQFAGDIRRHLDEIPVMARPDTLRYRSVKFARRHTGAVATAVLFVLTLLGGIAATSWEARVARVQRARAEQRFSEVRELANSVLFDLHDAIEPLPGSTRVRALLVKKAQHYLDHLAAADPSGDDELNRERAAACERIGDVLGLPVKPNLGDTQGALASYATALRLERSLLAAHGDDVRLRSALSNTLSRVCNVEQSTGRFEAALRDCGEMLGIEKALAAAAPQDPERQAELAAAYQTTAGAWFAKGGWAKSEEYRAHALGLFEQLHTAYPANEAYEVDLANACLRMANVQEQEKRWQPARGHAERAATIFAGISARHPTEARRRMSVTYALQRLGSVLADMGDLRGARETFLKSLPIREQLLAIDPQDASARVNLSNTLAALGYVELQMGRLDEGLPHFERQKAIAEELVAADPLRIEHQYSLSEAIENIGKVSLGYAVKTRDRERRARYVAEARGSLRRALQIYDSLRGRNAISAEYAHVPARIEDELRQCDRL